MSTNPGMPCPARCTGPAWNFGCDLLAGHDGPHRGGSFQWTDDGQYIYPRLQPESAASHAEHVKRAHAWLYESEAWNSDSRSLDVIERDAEALARLLDEARDLGQPNAAVLEEREAIATWLRTPAAYLTASAAHQKERGLANVCNALADALDARTQVMREECTANPTPRVWGCPHFEELWRDCCHICNPPPERPMADGQARTGCTVCGHVILADSEDWGPMCPDHYAETLRKLAPDAWNEAVAACIAVVSEYQDERWREVVRRIEKLR